MKDLRLVNKLKRRAKYASHKPEVDLREEVMADSPGALKYLRGIQRRLQSYFGQHFLPKKPKLSVEFLAELERTDFGVNDFGIQVTMASGLISELGIRPGDAFLVREGSLEGRYLNVVSVESATKLRLEDVATFTGPESDQACRCDMADTKGKSYS